jgi:hypothetical protein
VVGGKAGHILVIGDDLNSIWGAFQERAPFLEGMGDYEKSFVIDLMVDLCWEMLFWEIGHGVKNTVIIIL